MAIVNFAPEFTVEDAVRLVRELYGLDGAAQLLPSERDQNFFITSDSCARYVLKIANAIEEYTILEAQSQVMEHVAKHDNLLPMVVPSRRGEKIEVVTAQDGRSHNLRLVTYTPGTPMGAVKRHNLLSNAQEYLIKYPWLAIFPGLSDLFVGDFNKLYR